MLKAPAVNEAVEAQVNSMREAIWMRMMKLKDIECGDTTSTLLANSAGVGEAKGRIRGYSEEAKS